MCICKTTASSVVWFFGRAALNAELIFEFFECTLQPVLTIKVAYGTQCMGNKSARNIKKKLSVKTTTIHIKRAGIKKIVHQELYV